MATYCIYMDMCGCLYCRGLLPLLCVNGGGGKQKRAIKTIYRNRMVLPFLDDRVEVKK